MPVPYKFFSGKHAFKKIHGIFCVYKPEGMLMPDVITTLKTKILEEINALPNYIYETSNMRLQSGSRKLMAGQKDLGSRDKLVADNSELSLTKLDSRLPVQSTPDSSLPTQAGSLACFSQNQLLEDEIINNRLVLGDRYEHEDWHILINNGLAKYSSGIVVLGSGTYKHRIKRWSSLLTQVYHLKGRLGWASDSYDIRGRIVERSTFNHVNRSLVEKVCATMEANHQRKMFEYSGVNPESQEAYELATQGLLRPSLDHKEPIIYSIKCVNFEPPNFTLEIHVINEKCQYLSEVVHGIGLLMNTTAVCAGIRRIRSGLYGIDYSLLYQDWNLNNIKQNVEKCRRVKLPVAYRRKSRLCPTLGYLGKGDKVVFKYRKPKSQSPTNDATESLKVQGKDTTEGLKLQGKNATESLKLQKEIEEKERIEKEVRMLLSTKLDEKNPEEKNEKSK